MNSAIERIAAGLLLTALTPLLAICALAIFLEDRGPVLFRQCRTGRGGRPFMLLKLRSMRSAAGHDLTARTDDRITAVGRVLRAYKIDELPQLWNVIRGEMSVIGPRPEIPRYVDPADARWQAVLSVKPGLTDLSSLVYRDEEGLLAGQKELDRFYREWLLPRKLELSSHYIRTRSPIADAKLLVLTLIHVVGKRICDKNKLARQFDYRGGL